MLLVEYPKCSTCKKAKAFLDNNKISYIDRNIVSNNPSKEELRKWIEISDLDISKFFNTSGIKYREMNLKEVLKEISFDEKLDILSTDGMLVKRPLLIIDNKVLIGFKQKEWEEVINR